MATNTHNSPVHGITVVLLGLLLLAACYVAGPLIMVLVSRLW